MKRRVANSRTFGLLIALVAVVAVTGSASAASLSGSLGVVPYPSKGQSPQQQSADEGQCYDWAKQQTGIDPMAVAAAPTTTAGPAAGGGQRVKGAAGGALGGAAIGAIAGDAGKGAAIGAVAGTMMGGAKARKDKEAQSQQAQQAKSSTLQQFNKAFGACMEGRGYVVK